MWDSNMTMQLFYQAKCPKEKGKFLTHSLVMIKIISSSSIYDRWYTMSTLPDT